MIRMGTRPCQSFKQIISSKLLKAKKLTKMMKRITNVVLPLPPMFRKPGSKTVNAAHLAKSLATSQLIFKPKRFRLLSQDDFLQWDDEPVTLPPQSGTFNGDKDIKTTRQPSYFLNTTTADFFCYRKGKVRASRPIVLHQDGLMTNFEGVILTNLKMSLPLPFGSGWTAAISMSQLARTRPKNVPK